MCTNRDLLSFAYTLIGGLLADGTYITVNDWHNLKYHSVPNCGRIVLLKMILYLIYHPLCDKYYYCLKQW